MFDPTPAEIAQRDAVMQAVRTAWETGTRIALPRGAGEGAEVAMVRAGEEPNPYGGIVGPFRYQFEGEDDLLHLMVVRQDYAPLAPEEGQKVARFLIPDMVPGLIWLKPGTISQHFYVGDLP